jgi:LPXTG-motif cell wall-anchored protein
LKASRKFDPATNSWQQAGSMNWGRWYPSALTLADGDIFVASGVTKLIKPIYTDQKNLPNSGKNVPQTETYDAAANAWSDNGPSGERSLPLYPRLHLLPNGHVYYDAAGQVFNPVGYAYDELLWNIAATYDPETKSWNDLGIPGLETGDLTAMGFRGSTFSAMLPLKAPYDKASFLSGGGILAPTPGTVLGTPFSRINTVTMGPDGSESLTTTVTDPMNNGRWYTTGVVLPDGTVFGVNGASLDEVAGPGDGMPLHQAELFTPDGDGGGSWAPVASLSHDRTYHSTAVLLPDGRVLVGGHSPIPNNYTRVMSFPDPFSNNSRDASFEIYSPPYLFKGERPVIGKVNQELGYGSELVIPTQDAESIESVVLVRNASLTHLVDADQRTVELPIVSKSGGNVKVSVTDMRGVLPPGPYMLFINKGSDKGLIPSVSRQVYVGAPLPEYLRTSGLGSAEVLAAQATRSDGGTLPSTGGDSTPALAGLTLLVVGGLGGVLRRRMQVR